MLGRRDEVNEGYRLIDELMIAEHRLLHELSLPLGEPWGKLLILVIV